MPLTIHILTLSPEKYSVIMHSGVFGNAALAAESPISTEKVTEYRYDFNQDLVKRSIRASSNPES